MEKFYPSQTYPVWYNVRIPYTRDESIFDIGPAARDERRLEISFPGHRPEATGGPRLSRPIGRRDPSPPPPATSGKRNSVLGFVVKPLTFHNEKPSTMVRRVASTRRALYLVFRSGS